MLLPWVLSLALALVLVVLLEEVVLNNGFRVYRPSQTGRMQRCVLVVFLALALVSVTALISCFGETEFGFRLNRFRVFTKPNAVFG